MAAAPCVPLPGPSPRPPRRRPAPGCGRRQRRGGRSVLPRADPGGWHRSQPPPESGTRGQKGKVRPLVCRRRADGIGPGRAGPGPHRSRSAVAYPKAVCVTLSLQAKKAPGAWQYRCCSLPWDSFYLFREKGALKTPMHYQSRKGAQILCYYIASYWILIWEVTGIITF